MRRLILTLQELTFIITLNNAGIRMWIYECSKWPDFTWDETALSSKLASLRHQQGRLLGRMEGLGFELQLEASLNMLTDDVVKSSAIEGENLNPQEVRSSIARRLGLDIAGLIPAQRNVEGIVQMMLDSTQRFSEPLTKERLFDWHAALFPTGRSDMRWIIVGNWRDSTMQVVSGPLGREKVHFEAPAAQEMEKEMQAFLKWFNNESDIDPVIKAGIAHLWFVTIHPFDDGNGRIARAIGDMSLARADGMSHRFYSLSSQIETERKHYYNNLEWQQRSTTNITNWLSWFLDCLSRAITRSETTLGNVLFKARLWETINQKPINERQRLIINRMLEDDFEGFMSTSKYARMTKCADDTALRDIKDLKSRGVFIQNPGKGRSTSYRLPDRDAYLQAPQNI